MLRRFERYQQRTAWCREAGGQLFARLEEPNVVRVQRATGPRWSDRRGRAFFEPNRRAERREIRRLFAEGEHFVGDWHTHPEGHPMPSPRDIESVQEMFVKSRHSLSGLFMVIVGTATLPDGLFVALATGDAIHEMQMAGPMGCQ